MERGGVPTGGQPGGSYSVPPGLTDPALPSPPAVAVEPGRPGARLPGPPGGRPPGPPGGRPRGTDVLLLAVGVLGVSTSGPLIAATAAPPLAIALYRNAFSLILLVPATARRIAELRGIHRRTWLLCVGAGALLAAHFACWVPSLSYTSVASSTALVCMQAVWTAVFARLTGHPVSGRTWAGMALALLGVLVVTGVDVSVDRRALFGDALALVGGVFSGAYVVLGAHVRRAVSTTTYTTVCYGGCSALLLAGCLAAGAPLAGYAAADWARLAALTVTAQLLGHSVFNLLLRRVSPTLVSLTILLEVPGAALLAALWLGQLPPWGAGAGMVLLLAGIGVVVTGTSD